MVSKAAVIAIVAILAVPILLGYALNVEQVTETEYKTTGDSVNVSQLLQTGTGYSYANADIHKMNSEFGLGAFTPAAAMPVFDTTNNKTSLKASLTTYLPGGHPIFGGPAGVALSSWNYVYVESYDEGSGGMMVAYYRDSGGNLIQQVNNFHSVYWDLKTMKLSFSYYSGSGLAYYNFTVPSADYKIGLSDTGGYVGKCYVIQDNIGVTTTYADISAGYHFIGSPSVWAVKMPDHSYSSIITIDLDSITDSDYSILIGGGGHSNIYLLHPYYLIKTTTAGVVSWKITSYDDPSKTWDLYYDPDIQHNTYQFYWDYVYDHSDEPYYDAGNGFYWHNVYYTSHREFRYVGNWPTSIGEANVYWTATDDVVTDYPMIVNPPEPIDTTYNFNTFYFCDVTSSSGTIRSPTIRVDAALFRAFEYPVIEDRTYDAASFKTNPSTTINDPVIYGSSFEFGGNTYTVDKGNITMGTHKIPVKGLVLSSVPNPDGGYDNKIGNTVISTTAAPSVIKFNGIWSASISTIAQEEYQVTKTEWKAGSFAWDGIDHNFIMAGLLASLGAFVGVGIYARRTKSSVWPLLIVCGGAALLFFLML